MLRNLAFQPLRWLLVGSVAVVLAACDGLLGIYNGPQPAQTDITEEVVVVRSWDVTPSGQHQYIMDRVRFTEAGDPHNVNRVVWVSTTEATAAAVIGLDLQTGDRVTISTEFSGVRQIGELTEVPNWPGHRSTEYPIGVHLFTSAVLTPDA
jgi:hypothetical protein